MWNPGISAATWNPHFWEEKLSEVKGLKHFFKELGQQMEPSMTAMVLNKAQPRSKAWTWPRCISGSQQQSWAESSNGNIWLCFCFQHVLRNWGKALAEDTQGTFPRVSLPSLSIHFINGNFEIASEKSLGIYFPTFFCFLILRVSMFSSVNNVKIKIVLTWL